MYALYDILIVFSTLVDILSILIRIEMNILAFETSIGNCSVALFANNKEYYLESKNKMMQSEELIIMVNQILNDNNISYKQLTAIACSIGPGSFTGIRVGIAAARGMKKALKNVRLVGVSTLEALVHNDAIVLTENQKILTILKAYGDEFYVQEFDSDKNPLSQIHILQESELKESYKKYDLILSHQNELVPTTIVELDARSILNIAKNSDQNTDIIPLYIKKPNIHKNN